MLQILNNGLDQYLRFRASAIDESGNITGPFTGTVEGDPLPDAIMIFTEFKTTPEDTVLEEADTEVIWKATAGELQAKIPEEYITRDGLARLNISGTGMVPVAIDLVVGAIGGSSTGSGRIIKDFTHDATAQTIQFTDTTLTKADILKITGVDSNLKIYDSDNPVRGKNIYPVEGTPGLFRYEYGDVPEGETLQIIAC